MSCRNVSSRSCGLTHAGRSEEGGRMRGYRIAHVCWSSPGGLSSDHSRCSRLHSAVDRRRSLPSAPGRWSRRLPPASRRWLCLHSHSLSDVTDPCELIGYSARAPAPLAPDSIGAATRMRLPACAGGSLAGCKRRVECVGQAYRRSPSWRAAMRIACVVGWLTEQLAVI